MPRFPKTSEPLPPPGARELRAAPTGGRGAAFRFALLAGAALLCVTPAFAGLWGARDQYLTRLTSGVELDPETLDRFGETLALGDFNADGFADVAVGVPGAVVGGDLDAGSVHVFYGSANGFRTDNDEVFDQDIAGIAGDAEPGDQFGSALATGDFDGDGYADLAIGAAGEDIGSVVDAGAIWILYGSAGGGLSATGSDDFNESSPGVPQSTDTEDRMGHALAGGDFDGDGFDDLAVGIPGKDHPNCAGGPDDGEIVVFPGSAGGVTTAGLQSVQAGNVVHCGAVIGESLAAADFDDDGYEDLAYGVPTYMDGGGGGTPESGAIYVVAGSAAGLDNAVWEIWSQESAGVPGTAEDLDHMGEALAIGNFDGNSRADLAIGLPFNGDGVGDVGDPGGALTLFGSSSLLTSTGANWIEQGSAGVPDTRETNDRFGNALASGDFDGDGYGDLAIAAAEEDYSGSADAGIVIVLEGSPAGLVEATAQRLSQDLPGAFEDTDPGDEFGRSLAAGDVDGDGVDDLVVGVPGQTIGVDADAGAIHLFRGALFAADFEDGAGLTEWSAASP